MANTIKIRRSATASAVPTTTQIALGELAVNTNDGKLFLKRSTTGAETGAGVTVVEVGGTTTTATNLAGGSVGTVPYQSSSGTTAMLAVGTAGQALVSAGAAAPAWTTLTMENIPDAAFKRSVRVATTANITLSGTQTIDGIAVVAGNRVLVKNQNTPANNGIYVVASGAWSRPADANIASEMGGATVNVDSGTTQGGQLWSTRFKITDTLGTTAMTWAAIVDTSFASATTPNNIGTAATGTSTSYARADHVHAITGSAITSGTIGGSTVINTSGAITTSSNITDSIGNVRDIIQNPRTAAYTLVTSDAGKHISITTGGVTVPSGIFTAGEAISIFNNSAANQTITQGASVTMYLAGSATTGNRTLAQRGICTVLCVAANTFVISGAGLS